MEKLTNGHDEVPVKARLILELMENGAFRCSGPFENKLLCYGMLETAKDAVRQHGGAVLERPGLKEVKAFGRKQ